MLCPLLSNCGALYCVDALVVLDKPCKAHRLLEVPQRLFGLQVCHEH